MNFRRIYRYNILNERVGFRRLENLKIRIIDSGLQQSHDGDIRRTLEFALRLDRIPDVHDEVGPLPADTAHCIGSCRFRHLDVMVQGWFGWAASSRKKRTQQKDFDSDSVVSHGIKDSLRYAP